MRHSDFPAASTKTRGRVTTKRAPQQPVSNISRETAEFAKQMLENPEYDRVIERMRGEAFAAFTDSKPDDTTAREIAYYRVRAIDELSDSLRAMAGDLSFNRGTSEDPT